ncbi:MAG: putative DNA binding domain-containing protein [Candidatus Delongbacteria bacterium]|nr:putative DNA binding domain-containing protein [Candidatus Delongbacteria bacterium]
MNTFKSHSLDMILQFGEGQYVEFKESLDKSFAKEIVAFANASGGVIYLGITDKGEIKGISNTNKLRSAIQDIARNCDPSISISLHDIDNVIAVEIEEGKNKPYSSSSGFFMRMGANSQKMTRNEILQLAIKSGKVRFDEQICTSFKWNDFDDDKFKYYLKLAGISYNLERDEILRNLKVLTDDGFTNAGVLYFAKEPSRYIISSQIRCVHFYGDDRVNILDKKVFDKGIIGNIEHAIEYIKDRVPVRYEIKNLARDEFPEYPIEAYREAIVNAIIHFDYFLGDMIAIEKLKSSIIINNKGELLFPKEEFGKKSESRNRLLADLLSRTIFMEKAGTGIKRVKDACNENGNKISFDFTDSFWVVIETNADENVLDGTVNDTVTVTNDTVNIKDDTVNDTLSKIQRDIISAIIFNNNITYDELATQLNKARMTIYRNIKELLKMNYLKREGSDKTGHWVILKNNSR